MNRAELELNAALSKVNGSITRYILRVLDEDNPHCTTEYTRPIGEVTYALGTELVEVGNKLVERAAEHGYVVIEVAADEVWPAEGPPDEPPQSPRIPEF